MNTRHKRNVDQQRAAALLRLAEKELSQISCQAGLGHKEESDAGAQTYYSYDELRRICRLTARRVA